MLLEAVWIGFAFSIGLLVRLVGLPSLVGYLAAGFAISTFSTDLGLPLESSAVLQHVAHIGVLLLLFSVGLKLNVRNLVQAEVIGGGLLHFGFSILFLAPALYLFLNLSVFTAVMLATALAFSSTVLAARVLEGKRELRAFHGRVAIGILIIQDLIALVVISFASGTNPSPWALLVFALPLSRPLLYRLFDASGHEDLLVLFGLLLALGIGGYGFEVVGLSAELGALLMIALLPLKGALFFFLLVGFKLRARSAFLSSLSLTNYSEFGLIMASIVLPEWLVPLALTAALSFVISAPINRFAHPLYERLAGRLIPFERDTRHPDEQPVSLGDAQVLIMGLGRTGTAAYEHLKEKCRVIGLDSDPARVELYIMLAGADQTYLTMSEAGVGLAEHVHQKL